MKIGIFGLLTILFVLLKVFDIIDWSWWLVFSPILINLGIFIFAFVLTAFIGLFVSGRD